MKNITGLQIKMNREKMGFKQEYLCKGICAVSYLSKIEKGSIIPSDDIIKMLFKRLHIEFYQDEVFIKEGKEEFEKLYQSQYTGLPVDYKKIIEIKSEKEKYLNSPLYIDYQLFELSEKPKDSTQILNLKEYMDTEQLYKAYYFAGLVYGDMNLLFEAKKLKYAPEVLYGMGYVKWQEGKYYEAIELLLESLNLAYSKGYIKLQMIICLILGHIYMDFHLPTMEKYYEKVLLLSKLVKDDSMDYLLHYHIGIAYTAKNFTKAEDNLQKAIETCPADEKDGLEKIYQKLCFLYVRYNQMEKAKDYYKKAIDINHFESVNELIKIMVEEEDYIHQKSYINQLSAIYKQSKKHNIFSNTKYYGDFLIETYKANRRYKEALEVTEYLYAFLTQDN
ncbi:helix-turn-helix domain-containing protein [Anaerocolumna sedimenticola]|uniref:Helix-turn-helix domain-containing protein n=1 Tax=Anaerocolumna sedimenticola TaxID=2696063 RepID=A0A6P1TMV8_9FIRM|nr:helix-turn-helix transcriptional regulator [Anaerocolumna sedimenticola]QHQ61657.1 helix-turn-helix domain-containing protein [Anaerocolumna sedimenticola]